MLVMSLPLVSWPQKRLPEGVIRKMSARAPALITPDAPNIPTVTVPFKGTAIVEVEASVVPSASSVVYAILRLHLSHCGSYFWWGKFFVYFVQHFAVLRYQFALASE